MMQVAISRQVPRTPSDRELVRVLQREVRELRAQLVQRGVGSRPDGPASPCSLGSRSTSRSEANAALSSPTHLQRVPAQLSLETATDEVHVVEEELRTPQQTAEARRQLWTHGRWQDSSPELAVSCAPARGMPPLEPAAARLGEQMVGMLDTEDRSHDIRSGSGSGSGETLSAACAGRCECNCGSGCFEVEQLRNLLNRMQGSELEGLPNAKLLALVDALLEVCLSLRLVLSTNCLL